MEKNQKNELQTINIQISSDTIQRIKSVIQQKDWEFDQGVRRILGAGLGYLEMETHLQNDSEPEKDSLIRRIIEAESLIASLQFKLFETESANQNWNLSSGAILGENIGLKNVAMKQLKRIDRLTLQNALLNKEILELKEQNEKLLNKSEIHNHWSFITLLNNLFKKNK
jgi:hypothetical protein